MDNNDGELGVALTYFGDGASSQGDVHEAMNFAAVMKAPVVFFVQNNGWAISVPTERQVAGGSVAARAAGYGMPALKIDGDDVVAVLEATRRAFAHARSGNGPVLIEAMTYRRGPHSTSDDPGRYRSLDEERDGAGDRPARAGCGSGCWPMASPTRHSSPKRWPRPRPKRNRSAPASRPWAPGPAPKCLTWSSRKPPLP